MEIGLQAGILLMQDVVRNVCMGNMPDIEKEHI
jgi:hypothetical protein